jgi:sugar lactone lactonase YvrE
VSAGPPAATLAAAPRWLISQGIGRFPAWSRNGQELFYLDSDNRIVSRAPLGADSVEPRESRTCERSRGCVGCWPSV